MDVITPQESEIQTPDIQSEKRRVLILFVKLGLFILSIFTFRILAGVVGRCLSVKSWIYRRMDATLF